jgi:hypothetical protein
VSGINHTGLIVLTVGTAQFVLLVELQAWVTSVSLPKVPRWCVQKTIPPYMGVVTAHMPYMYANNDSTLDPAIQDCESGFYLKNQVFKSK